MTKFADAVYFMYLPNHTWFICLLIWYITNNKIIFNINLSMYIFIYLSIYLSFPQMDLSSLVSSSKSPRRRHAGGSLSGSLCGGSQNLVPGSTTGGSLTNSHGGSAPRLYSTGSKSTSELEGLRNALQDRDAVIHKWVKERMILVRLRQNRGCR